MPRDTHVPGRMTRSAATWQERHVGKMYARNADVLNGSLSDTGGIRRTSVGRFSMNDQLVVVHVASTQNFPVEREVEMCLLGNATLKRHIPCLQTCSR